MNRVVEFKLGYDLYMLECTTEQLPSVLAMLDKVVKLADDCKYSRDRPATADTKQERIEICINPADSPRYDGVLRKDETSILRQKLAEAKEESEKYSKWWTDSNAQYTEAVKKIQGLTEAIKVLEKACPVAKLDKSSTEAV